MYNNNHPKGWFLIADARIYFMELKEFFLVGLAIVAAILGVYVYAKMSVWRAKKEVLSGVSDGDLSYSTLKKELTEIEAGKRPVPNQVPTLFGGLFVAVIALALYLKSSELSFAVIGLSLIAIALITIAVLSIADIPLRRSIAGRLLTAVLFVGIAVGLVPVISGFLKGEGWENVVLQLSRLF